MPALKNPFEKFKIKWAKTERIFLTPMEVHQYLSAYRSGELGPVLQKVCRQFLFQCFTGLRVGDAKMIDENHEVGNYLVFQMNKTKDVKMLHKVPLNAVAREMLNDARKERRAHGTGVFDFYKDDSVYRTYLKSLSIELGLGKHVTSHIGRHTFATSFLLAGGKVERLSKLLGHSKLETTMIYVHIVEEYMAKDMDALADFFSTEGKELNLN